MMNFCLDLARQDGYSCHALVKTKRILTTTVRFDSLQKSKEFTVQQLSEESPRVGTNVYALPAAAEAEWRFSYRFSKTRTNHVGTLAFGFSLIALIVLAVNY